MSGGPGGLFPLLRSAAAAEIAKHFGTVEGGTDPMPSSVRAEGAVPQGRTVPSATVPSTPSATPLTVSTPVLSDTSVRPQGALAPDFAANLRPGFTPHLATTLAGLTPPRLTATVVPSSVTGQAPSAPAPDAPAAPPRPAMPMLEGGDPVLLAQQAQEVATTPETAPVPAKPMDREGTGVPAQAAVTTGQSGTKGAAEPTPATGLAKADAVPQVPLGQPLSHNPGLPNAELSQFSVPTGTPIPVAQVQTDAAPVAASGQTLPRAENAVPLAISASIGSNPALGGSSSPVAFPQALATDPTGMPAPDMPQRTETQAAPPMPDRAAQARPIPDVQMSTAPARPEPLVSQSQATAPASGTMSQPMPTTQMAAALSPAIAEALVTGGFPLTFGGQGPSAASLVIFNAAMIPSWPPALQGDAPQQVEAALRAGGAVMAQMSPEEAAEYLAKMAAAFGFLLTVKKRLAQSLKEEKETLLGLFSFLGVALETLSKGLQMALDLTTEQREMLAELALAQGDEGGRPPHKNRQRLRL